MARVKVPAYAVVGATQTIYTIDGKVLTGVGVAVPLADLADYARGSIIRGGAADWEAYDAKTAGSVLIGDGTDLVSTVNPTLTGTLTLPNAGLHLLDTNASHDLIIAPGSDLTADRTLTLTTGDVARTVTLTGNATLADWFDQSVKVAAGPTFASVTLPNAGWIGNSAATARLGFDSSGAQDVAYFMGCYLGAGLNDPVNPLSVYTNTSAVYATYIFNDQNSAGHGLHVKTDGTGSGTKAILIECGGGTAFEIQGNRNIYFGVNIMAFNYTTRRMGIRDNSPEAILEVARPSGTGDTDDYFYISEPANGDGNIVKVDADGLFGINKLNPHRRQHTCETSASTNVIIPVARFESEVSGGVGAAGHGAAIEFYGESDTTTNQAMGLIAARWSVATHASRRSRFELRAWYIGNETLVGVIEAPSAASVDGNARGAGAVDWQGYRSAATQVASGVYAALGGGFENTVSGDIATIPGGYSCLASGDNSFATGYDAHATHNQSFVLSATNAQTVSWAVNTFTTRCHGGARFYSAVGVGTGVQLTAGGNAWAGISDRNVKENFRPVEGILGKIALLPIYDYNLKSQSADIRHIGPMSQDFNTLFGFSEAPLRINMLDIASVGLAGIQALHAEMVVLQERVQILEARLID